MEKLLRRKIINALSIISLLLTLQGAWAQSIWTNPITGSNPGQVSGSYTSGQTVASNLTVSGISKGPGIAGNAANDRYNATGWTTSGSIDTQDYFQFTLTPASGYKINFVSFVYSGQKSGSGPDQFAVRSSVDNYQTNIYTYSKVGTSASSWSNEVVNLSASGYQNVTGAITFRYYAYEAGSASGTFSINDFTFNGAVVVAATAPTVTTSNPATAITLNSASAGGNVTSIGTAAVTAKGVVWGTSQNPTITTNTGITTNGTGIGAFTSSLTGLSMNTTYYYRAYATNSVGTSYGTQYSFTTLNIVAPTVTTTAFNALNDADIDTAQLFGGVTNNGGEAINERGFVWNTTGTNLNAGQATTVINTNPGDSDAAYSEIIDGLLPNTQYYYRAYASNTTGGTGYGATNSFYTLAVSPAAPSVTNISFNTAEITVNANGNTSTTQYVIRVLAGGNTFYLNATGTLQETEAWLVGSSIDNKIISGLAVGSEYTFDMKARNGSNIETVWSATTVIQTLEPTDPYFTLVESDLDFGDVCINNSANGYFTFGPNNVEAGQQIAVYALDGFSYSLTENGTYATGLFIPYSGTGTVTVYVNFTPVAVQGYPGLVQGVPGTIDINSAGGETLKIAVSGAGINTPAAVSTGVSSDITVSGAAIAGQASPGCTPITAYGIEYSTIVNFTNGAGTQLASDNIAGTNFNVNLSGLEACTTYYYKAYATDGAGTNYGAQQSFVTSSLESPVANAAGSIAQAGFIASWSSVEGATGYTLDVSTSPDFETVLLDEDFATVTQPAGDTEITATLSSYGLSGWSGIRIYGEDGHIRAGISGTIGNVTTPTIDLSGNGGNATLTFETKYHGTDGKSIRVMHAANGSTFTQAGSDIALTAEFQLHTIAISGGTANSKIRIIGAETPPNRFHIDNVKVSYSGALPAYTNLAVAGTSYEVTGLDPNTIYYYRVQAEAGCSSGNSNTVQLQTLNYLALVNSSLNFGDICTNAEATGSFTFNGSDIAGATLNIAALAGYSFSLTEAGTYSETLAINDYNGDETTVYVKFTPSAIQSYNGNISLTGEAETPYAGAALAIPVSGSGINTPAVAAVGIAADITMVSATLSGQSDEAACTSTVAYGVEYSATNNFVNGSGTQIAATNIDETGNYTVPLTGLTACTTYYFKAYTTTADGTVYSSQASFTTAAITAPVAIAAEEITAAGFTANWESVENAEGYVLDVSTSPQFSSLTTGPTNTENFIVMPNSCGSSSHLTWGWTGSSGITWTAYKARININIDGSCDSSGDNAVTLDDEAASYIESGVISGGITNLQFDVEQQFSGTGGVLTVSILTGASFEDETIVGTINYDPTLQVFNSGDIIGISGDFKIKISNNALARPAIDNLIFISDDVNAPSYVQGYENLAVNNVTFYEVVGLAPFTTYYYRVRGISSNCTTENSNVVEVTTNGAVIWQSIDGTAQWTPEFYSDGVTPVVIDTTTPVIIETDYNTAVEGVFESESITINSGVLTVAAGTTLTIQDALINNAAAENFIVENGAALIQVNDVNNTGDITVNKDSNELFKLDYTVWSSPVAGQTLGGFSPATHPSRFYTYGVVNGVEDYISQNPSGVFQEGIGYLIRMPNHLQQGDPNYQDYEDGVNSLTYNGVFTGNPNNGAVTVPLSTEVNYTTMIGNPYPSPISVQEFFTANSGVLQGGQGIYFWRKKNNQEATSYATLTTTAYTANDGGAESGEEPGTYSYGGQVWEDYFESDPTTWVIAPGQGFYVSGNGNAGNVTFTNGMRRATVAGQPFFRMNNNDNGQLSRIWLNLYSETNFNQTAVAYTEDGTLGADYGMDARNFSTNGNLALYSVMGNDNFTIQTRPAFDPEDVVPMGYTVANAGTYRLALHNKDGVFAAGQNVYLKDNLLDLIHDFTDGQYAFTTEAGTFNDRFDIVYSNEVLSTNTPETVKNDVVVYKQDNVLNVISANADIRSITVFDIRGRILYAEDNINSNKAVVSELQSQQQVILVKVITDKGTVNKKVVY